MGMVQQATKKETARVAAGTGTGAVLMLIVFAILHAVMPQKVPFDAPVFLGAILGGLVAVANFFLMGLTVQKVADEKDEKQAYQKMKLSYTYRMLLQAVWIILALALPFVNGAAGVIPLLFPSITIKIYYIFCRKRNAQTSAPAQQPQGGGEETAGEERGDRE